ncbi:hypothetical protein AAF712_016530 [Marasmius tenuissimus]|uniref:RanBP2-type domain-containing protein n=1 Tax=Marasmius tenuissimus TaxID=585030 RepID=A0ABR2Z5I5_9AGAR
MSSPVSSTCSSSSFDSFSAENVELEMFLERESRVLEIVELPPETFRDEFFSVVMCRVGPATLWSLRGGRVSRAWAVFPSHQEACAALTVLSVSPPIPIAVRPAQARDLEPFEKLQRVVFKDTTAAAMNIHHLSTNPPPPPSVRSQFRVGDWICRCGVHNFGRNQACIGCNTPRTISQPTSPLSPRFQSNHHSYASASPPVSPLRPTQQQAVNSVSAPLSGLSTTNKSAHPLLTPSGRAFAIGGRVQNVSSDPLNPCIMYWPDNEPFPDPGQLRPGNLAGVNHPPILNTGNRGPISHQPGDWICRKCNYLNWRRRKVCQTCLPYAEGNGDSISAAVQAERIALLTSVLAHTQTQQISPAVTAAALNTPPQSPLRSTFNNNNRPLQRSLSVTPPRRHQHQHQQIPPQDPLDLTRSLANLAITNDPIIRQPYRSRSHFELGGHAHAHARVGPTSNSSPAVLYQTSSNPPSQPQQIPGGGGGNRPGPQPLQEPLLPSFLLMPSPPTHHPLMTRPLDLPPPREFEITSSPTSSTGSGSESPQHNRTRGPVDLKSIWQMDHQELLEKRSRSSRDSSQDGR